MGEIIFSLFVGIYFIIIGLFMNWYLKKEMNRVGTNDTDNKGGQPK